MENPHTVNEEPCASAHKELEIKSKTVMSWRSRKKKSDFFCTVCFV